MSPRPQFRYLPVREILTFIWHDAKGDRHVIQVGQTWPHEGNQMPHLVALLAELGVEPAPSASSGVRGE